MGDFYNVGNEVRHLNSNSLETLSEVSTDSDAGQSFEQILHEIFKYLFANGAVLESGPDLAREKLIIKLRLIKKLLSMGMTQAQAESIAQAIMALPPAEFEKFLAKISQMDSEELVDYMKTFGGYPPFSALISEN